MIDACPVGEGRTLFVSNPSHPPPEAELHVALADASQKFLLSNPIRVRTTPAHRPRQDHNRDMPARPYFCGRLLIQNMTLTALAPGASACARTRIGTLPSAPSELRVGTNVLKW